MHEAIAPRDPIKKKEALYILIDVPIGGGGTEADGGKFPIFINDDRLVTFAKIVGGIQDEKILERAMRTTNNPKFKSLHVKLKSPTLP